MSSTKEMGLGNLEVAERLVVRNRKLARLKADCSYRVLQLTEKMATLHQQAELDGNGSVIYAEVGGR